MFQHFFSAHKITAFTIKPPLLPRVTKGFFEKLLFLAGTPGCKTWAGPELQVLLKVFPPFAWGQQRKRKEDSEATSEPCVFVSHPCKRAPVTLFSSFICMLVANPTVGLKTNHSYWFHCKFAMWNNSQKKRLPCSYKRNKTPQTSENHQQKSPPTVKKEPRTLICIR